MLVHGSEKGAQLHCVWPQNGLRAGFPNRPCFSLPRGVPWSPDIVPYKTCEQPTTLNAQGDYISIYIYTYINKQINK